MKKIYGVMFLDGSIEQFESVTDRFHFIRRLEQMNPGIVYKEFTRVKE